MKTRICLAAAFAMFAVLAPLSAATTLSPTPGGWDVEANRLPAPDSRPPHLRVTNSWDGSSSTNWHTAANWSLNHVPLSTEDVYVPVTGITRWPVLSADGHCNALTVNSGASLTISGCELIVYTDAHLNGGFNMTGNSYLDVYMDLIFGAGALANFNNPGAFILVRGDVEFLAGSSVNIPSTMLDLYGTPVSYVRTYAPTTLGELYTYKPSSGFTSISNLSTHSLTLYMIWVSQNTTLYHPYSGTTYVTGDLLFSDTSLVQMNSGTISFTGSSSAYIEVNDSDCYLNNLTLNKSGSAVLGLENNLTVRGDLTIQTGVFDPGGWGVTVGGDWINQVGDGGFDEAGSTVVLNGTDDQSISSENFHNLVLNKSAGVMSIPAGSAVTCNSYDWVAGAYTVSGGSFTVADLADPGVFGTITLSAGTITYTQDTEQYIDLRCNLTISGGIFNLYGGNGTAWFSYIDVASLTMTNGTLDFKNQGIRIPASYAFTENISGGGIRTVGSFLIERSDFNPGGGTIELYGSANAILQNTDGSNLYRVFINKSATREGNELWPGSDPRDPQLEPLTRLNQVTGSGPLDINGNLVINSGVFVAPATIKLGGGWYNYLGPDAFVEGTGTVTLDGAGIQYCNYSETFNVLKLDKSAGAFRVNSSTAVVTCASYDWAAGAVEVLSGGFTANDLADSGIYGSFLVETGGTVNLYQDSSQFIDLNGYFYNNGGNITIHGGALSSYWAYADAAGITMSAGVIDFRDKGITIAPRPHALTINVTGGTIRSSSWFSDSRGGIVFAGGEVELYGPTAASVSLGTGSSFHDLKINKSPTRELAAGSGPSAWKPSLNHEPETGTAYRINDVLILTDLIVTNDLNISAGIFTTEGYNCNLTVGGNWTNNVGPAGFLPGTGTVFFNKAGSLQYIYGLNVFYNVTDNHTGAALSFEDANTVNGTLTVNGIVTVKQANSFANVVHTVSGAILAFYYNYDSTLGNYTGGGHLRAFSSHHVIIGDLTQNGLYGTFLADGGHLEFHQDSANWIDLNGPMTIQNNGSVDIYGGSSDSYFAYNGNTVFTLSSGEFNIRSYGIGIHNYGYSCDFSVSGGIMRVGGSWADTRGIFDPTGGTVEFTGSGDNGITPHASSWFWTLVINKTVSREDEPATARDREGNLIPITRDRLMTIANSTVKGGFIIANANTVSLTGPMTSLNAQTISINNGMLNLNGQTLASTGAVHVNSGGTLTVTPGAVLQMGGARSILVGSGGIFNAIGVPAEYAIVTRHSTGYYSLIVDSGGTIAARYAIFEYLGGGGIFVYSGATVDPQFDFDYCTFQSGVTGGYLLRLNTDQSFTVTGAHFPTNAGPGSVNVAKTVESGVVYFEDWSGAFGGPGYEWDIYNRIYWEGSGVPPLSDITISYLPSQNRVRLDWTYPFGATSYRIYRSPDPYGVFILRDTTTNNYWTELVTGTRYFYRVTAILP